MALNRIYKVVWSKTKGCYIVVSELAKRVGRNKAKAIVISSAAMAMAVSPVMTNTVGAVVNEGGTGGDTSVAWAKTSNASGTNAVAVGNGSQATENNTIAVGRTAQATKDSAIAVGVDSKATGASAEAIGVSAQATGDRSVAIGNQGKAEGTEAVAIGKGASASKASAVALGQGAQATGDRATAIGQNSKATQADTIALGTNSKSTNTYTVAFGRNTEAAGQRSMAFGNEAKATANDTIAIGSSSEAKKDNDIIIGKEAKSRDEGGGHSIAIGYNSTAGSSKVGAATNVTSIKENAAAGGVAIGVSSYTGVNRDNAAINSSVAIGAGAGAGFRAINTDGLPTGNGTDPDDNAAVLVKAFGGTTSKLDYFKKTGDASKDGFFSFQGVDINEGTALGRNTRAIGDQSVAIGAQSIAGMGSIVIGGNDIQAYDRKKYFKAADPNSADARGVNDFNAAVTPGTGKKKPTDQVVSELTITEKYNELVGSELDRSYRASYGQDGSTVIGMQAHSTTPLGVAIGTNSIVRKGAFGATAIGSGASVLANAEAAVAIGMGSEAQGNYAVAAGTAARAKEAAVAAGYRSNAEESAVAVGDHAQATKASVAVGQLAKAEKTADIAVGQGAVASGEQGAIAMGLGTQAQGDSSIMIGGSEITKVADQRVSYQKEKIGTDGKAVIKTEKKTEMIGGVPTDRTVRSVVMETTTGSIQQAYGELTNGGILNTTRLDYSSAANRNGHGSISMGVHSLSTGDLGTAIGTGARVTKLGGVALGTGAISELQNGVAIGTGSRADSRSIGTRQTDISYDEEGHIVPFDSKKVAYTFYWAGGSNTSEGDVVSFGSPGAERQLKNVAAGRIADDSTDAINGSQLNSVTKRMSNGWSVEAEKDKTSSGVLKLNGALATKGTEVHSANGKTTTRENPGTATGNVDKIRLNDEVKIRVGDNLVLHQEDASRPVYEDPDNPDRQTGTRVTSKFTYSLNPELTGLKSAQFKNDAGDTTDINGAGVTVTPVTAGKQPVSLTTAGLNNGGNAISNVAGNLPSTKNNDATTGASNATTSQAAPTLGNAANQVNPTNAATVSDVLNAGWNLQGNNKAVDFVKPYDTVNFVNGDGTTATVESTDGKTSTVKYSVNLGDGLKKDDATNKITVNAADKSLTVGTDGVKVNPGDKSLKTTDAGLTVNTADKSLEVTDAGLKVKAGDKTLTTDEKGLKVNTGEIESVTTGANPGTVKVKDGDTGKVATVDSVVNAVNSAAWIATSEKTATGELGATPTDQSVKAGDKVTFEADKNIKITQAGSKFTFATRDDVSFNTVQVGGSEGPKFAKAADGSIKVSDKDGTEPVKITNVKAGEISDTSTDAINGSQFHAVAKNTIKLAGQNGTSAATETDEQGLDKKGGIKFTVKSSDGTLLDVAAKGDTITLTPKTATLTTGTDGVPTANTTGGNLVTADQLVNTLKSMGWKATAGQDDKGTVTDATVELIKAGETVTFKAGNNLTVKQAGKNFIYSLQKDLTDLTSAGFKNAAGDKTAINGDGVTITPVTNGKQPVSLIKDGLNNGGNPITNVAGNLQGAKQNSTEPTTSATAPTLGTGADQVNKNNAATVGDVLQAGWNLQGNSTAVDFVKPYDTVNFVDGDGTTVSVTNTDTKTSTVKYSINLGNGLEKDDTTKKVQVKPADKSLAVGADGVKVNPGDKSLKTTDAGLTVNTADKSLEVTNDGLKVKTDNKTITAGDKGLTVNTGAIEPVTTGANPGTVKVKDGDAGKIATVDSVVNAVNNAAFTLKASADGGTRNAGSGIGETGELIKAGSTIEMIAGKNLDVKHDASGKITFATVENPSFNTVQVGGDQGPKLSKTDDGNIKVSDKDGTNPVNITNVKSNLPDTKNSDTTNTATDPSNATTSKVAPNTTNKTGDSYINPNNAATVSDVLNAGWNLQGNGSAVDFVKPYDTVNFVNGVNTTAVVSTVDGKTSNVTYNVTGLPITYTDKDGNLVSKIGDEFYKVNDKGQPLDAKGNPSTKVNKDGKPVDDAGNVIDPINTTNNPVKTSLVNPAPEANKTGTTSPTTLDNVTSKLENYKADPVNGKEPAKNSLRDLTNTNVTDNTVATVGDIRNMGWIVSSDKTTGANGTTTATEYSEAVKNANEVRFVGEGSAIVSGKTDDKGVRTITVKVDSQTGLNKTVTPVNYTKADGTKVYPQEVDNGDGTKTVKFFENPDGTGKEIPKSDVVTSVNGPEGTKNPTTLKNVKNNIPNVNDGSKTITTPDGTETAGDVENINKAPLTAAQAAELANPKTKDGQTNPKYIGNNAATVSDVLNAGWNLQNNGAAKDFVKPYDTVNFINGLNTTAVVTTSDDGTTSNVTYNVTGLPVTYTTEDGTPVTKIGDKYYKVNDQGQPVDDTGAPVTKFNKDGKPLDANGQEVPDVNITDKPLKTSLVNPAPETNKTGTTSPTSLSNVKNNIPTVNDEDKTAHKADGTAIGGKNNTEAPITAGDAANLLKPIVNGAPNPNFVGNNAATVSDVLNAGWNLQNNGTAKDFVKPYDTVNFVNGGNTTAVVTTNAAGTASDVTFNVTGLPVTYTTEDGAPVSKVGDKYYKVNDKGQPISDAGKPAVGTNNDGKLVDENNNVIEPVDTTKPLKTALVNPTPTGDKPNTTTATQLGNVTSGLDKYGDTVDGKEVPGSTKANNGLVDLSKPANGDAPKVSDNTAATVGDLRNMGWIVSSNKTTGENGAVTTDEYSATVKNANEVKFVGEGTAVVSGKTDDQGVRTITVKVDDQTSTNNAVTPVVYTDKDGKQVYPTGKTDKDGNQIFNTKPDGKGEDVTGPVKTTINGPKGTTSPTSLSNVKNNIPAVNDADKKVTNADGTDKPDAGNVANINKAPLTAEEAADLLKPTTKDGKSNPNFVGNNAATVSDVLNAGWNLQNNGTAKDFVKPYDTVNFVNGLNTTAVVTTSDDGTTSNVTYNVTGLPVTYTTADGTPVSKIGDKFYKVNDKGQPVDEQGNPSTKVNNNGEPIDGNGKVINPIDTAAKPLKTSLVNPAPETNKTGTTSPTTLDNVTSKLTNYSDPEVNGKAPVRNNLVDLSKPEQGEPNVSDNTVATVGDLRNMGWIVSSDKTTGETDKAYTDTVKNANEVKFVGEGTAIVSGKTDGNVRTITVKVDDQTSTNNSVTPVNYTKADGTKVYPKTVTDPKTGKEEVKFFENPDGSGAEIPKGDVVTSINGPEGTTSPTTLKNVKNNIPNVNDGSKTITNPDGTEKTGDVENINKAPLTAEEAAALANPKTKDGQTNPKYIGNNAATVSDVLNAGWNLQNNGAARDFVKPFDTVNFVNGVNTTAVVTTSEDGTTSNVTYNVTGLPVTYTTADGTPVSKIGDDYYTVNDKGQPIDANGKPSTKVNKDGKPVDENGNVIKPIDTTANPLTSSLVNPNVKNTDAEPNKKTTDPTQLGNVTSGLQKYGDTVDGKEVPGSTKANNGLVDLSTPTDGSKPKVSDNTAATVGDLRNMGWIVSSDKTTGETDKAYTDTVKNANEVKFVGEGTAIVSGKTDGNVRTITVKVDDQTSTNNSVTPVNYTKADGTKVYPKTVTDPKTGKEEVKFFENPDGSGAEIPKGDVVTSINGPEGTTSPTTLKNVKNNIPNVNDGSKTITNPDGTEKTGDVENINKAPLTAEEAAELANPKTKDGQANPKYIGNNAATVSDVLNAGWNLQNNGESRDFVKPYDTVNFVNGLGTTAVVTTREDNTASDVTFNVKAANGSVTVDENGVKVTTGEMKPAVGTDNKETGAIATPADPATAKQLKETLAAAEKDLSAAREALKEAEKALAADPKDPALQQAVADKKADVAAKQTPVDAAQKAHDEAGLNKVATVQNVAEAINNAGFNLKTSADGGEKLTGTKDDGELIKPSNTVEMVAGNNLTVKQDANGKITYATKDNVTFTNVDTGTLNVGSPNTYTDGKGNTYTKVGDNYYKPADVVNGAPKSGATPVDVTTTPVTPVSPVTMKAEAAKPATNNASDAQPSSALNVTSKDGKPTQITGVGSTLNTKSVDTTPQGTAPGATPNTTPTNLVDLEGTADAPVNKNAAATVGDLQNMGWVVSAKDGNGYKDVVKNANVVDFKGGKGIEITGKTLTDGTREITVGIKEGEVTNKVTITNANGTKTDAVKIGDNYYKVDKDGKPIGFEKGPDGKPAGTPLKVDPKTDKVTNAGAGFVTGNTVANAIQDSGWNVGIGSTDKDFSKDAKVYDKVNPNDDVKFANGANTNVSMVTVDALNEDGTKKATTFVKVDVNRDLKIDSVTTGGTAVDKNGNNLVKVGDDYYKESDIDPVTKQPKPNAKPVPKADVTPAKDGAMIVKNADGKDVVSATVGKDGSGAFAVKGKDGKDGISMTAKDGQGAIGVNGKDGATTTIKGDTITIKDKDGNTNTSTPTSNELKDTKGNTNTSTADKIELKDKAGNTNTSTPTTNVLKDTNGNTNTSNAAGTTYKDKDDNTAVVGPKEIALTDKSGDNKASFTNKDLIFNATDPKTGVEKTSHVSGDKIAFSTTDEMEKVFDKDGKPVIDPATGKQKEVVKMEKVFDKDGKPVIDPTTGKQKEVIKNPGNSTEYTNEGLKVIPNSTVARDANGNLTYVDANNEPVMKDKDGNFVYMGKDGKHKPGEKYAGAVGALKPNVVDNTRVISFGMDKPVLDKDGKPVTGPDGNPVMTEGISAGMQQMHNLAPGTKDTDAVNVSQLRGTTININNRINRSGAQAAALAGLQTIQYDPLEPTQVSAGLGYYQGASALALGVNHYKNESTLFHLGASFNGYGSEVMANASVTWKFGARADETAVKDTFRQGPISASYTLQDKVSALEVQNSAQKDEIAELRALAATQQAQIAELFKRLNEKA